MPNQNSTLPNNHTRLAVIETKVEFIQEALTDNKETLEKMADQVSDIATHIASQNGDHARIENNIGLLFTRVSDNEKETQKASVKAKIIWGILSAILTGALLFLLKMGLGG